MIDAFSTCPGCGDDWFAWWDDDEVGIRYECRNLCEYDEAVMP